VVEKDWWVVHILEIVFNTSIANHTVFKGGSDTILLIKVLI